MKYLASLALLLLVACPSEEELPPEEILPTEYDLTLLDTNDAGDEAWVERIIPALWGRGPSGVEEVRVLVDLVEQSSRADVVRAMANSPDAPLEKLRRLSQRYGKPVLFAEIGYDVSSDAASEPWRGERSDNPANRDLQRRLMQVALERLEREPHIAGMFWWKWMPGSRHHGDFSMRHPGVMEVVQQAWGKEPRISAE